MIIPVESIEKSTLLAIIEEFITREGTDYGELELSLNDKMARLEPQVLAGDVLVVFDEQLQTVNLVPKEQIG